MISRCRENCHRSLCPTILILLVLLAGWCQADEVHVSVSRVEGSVQEGMDAGKLPAGSRVSFVIHFFSPTSNTRHYGLTAGWRLYSPDGALFSSLEVDTIPGCLPFPATSLWVFRSYEFDGPGADTAGLVWVPVSFDTGLPIGYDQEILKISVTLDPASAGKTICLDSSFCSFGRYGWHWEWIGQENLEPIQAEWSGPYSFEIVECCVGRVGDVNGQGGDEPTVGDISTLIDALFISNNPNVIACLTEADANQSGGTDPTFEDITVGDISILIDYLFITGPDDATLGDCL